MRAPALTYRRPPGLFGVEILDCPDPAFSFAPHTHEAYVFWVNARGAERVSLGGGSDVLRPDGFGVVAPGETHSNHALTGQRRLKSLYVDEAVVRDTAEQLGGHADRAAFRSSLHCDPLSRRALLGLHACLAATRDPFLARESLLRVLTLLLGRHGEAPAPAAPPRDPGKVRRAEAAMREGLDRPLGLDELAARCGCTASHLIRLFRRERGMTPHAYLMELRLLRAQGLLAGGADIADAALASGFSDQSHLTRRFAARFGLTPGLYRLQVGRG